jgi:molybdopterin-guanine dinucleotide biosynthesis protein A
MRHEDGIIGVVLCGGRSSRLGGGDKPLLRLDGRTMLRLVLDRLRPQVDALAISANGDPARFADYALPMLPDTVPGFAGPLAGVLAAIRWAAHRPGCESVLTVAGDTPFFPADLARRLAAATSQTPDRIAVATSGGRRHPVFALWPIALADDLERFLTQEGSGRVNTFIDRHGGIDVAFPLVVGADGELDPFFNVNTPDDLAEARRLAEIFGP